MSQGPKQPAPLYLQEVACHIHPHPHPLVYSRRRSICARTGHRRMLRSHMPSSACGPPTLPLVVSDTVLTFSRASTMSAQLRCPRRHLHASVRWSTDAALALIELRIT